VTRRVPVAEARAFATGVLRAVGATEEEARVVSDVLVTADRTGIDTHGIQRLGYTVARVRRGVTRPGAPITVVRETPGTALVDGGHGFGHLVAVRAMGIAIEKARAVGVGAVAVRNSTHYGIAGYHAMLAVDAGLVGLTTTNARPALAPTRGAAPVFGTNPIAFGAPSDDDEPFLFDASMALVQRGRVEVLAREGRPLPEGWAVGADGRPAVDAGAVLRGLVSGEAALLPLGGADEATGGHKGYGLAMVVEILSGVLAGGPFLSALAGADDPASSGAGSSEGEGDAAGRRPYRTGHFFLALDPGAFVDPDDFRRSVSALVAELRAVRRRDPARPVLTAGERELRTARERDAKGIPVPDALAEELRRLAGELSVWVPPSLAPASPDAVE